ncbi:MAG: VWA domain-containing protein [Pseudomonadota bacterium]
MRKLLGLWDDLRAFARAKTGNVAMMFGLSLLPLALAAGAGLDYAQAMMVRASMMDALDAAALAVGSAANDKTIDPNKLAQQVFDANYRGPGHPTVTPSINGQSVAVTGTDSVATTILALAGTPSIAVSAKSIVVWGQTKMWVSLVLDNTGSMTQTDSTGLSKIAALKDASHQLLAKLQTAAATGAPGDVQVAIVPFAKDVNVGTGNVGASWLGWSDWDGPVKATSNTKVPDSTVGWGSNCPWSSGCFAGLGSTTNVSKIPSSGTYKGYICPDSMNSADPGMSGHFYNGCYTSTATQTATTTNVKVVPVTVTSTCTQVDSGTISCTQPSSSDGTATSNTTNTVYTSGYTADSGPTTTNSTVNGTPKDGTSSCSTKKGKTTCTWTRTTNNTRTDTTVTATGYNFTHSWVSLAHSYWKGCVMDRDQNDDTTSATPGNKFPPENSGSCNSATVMPLNYKWDYTSSGDNDNLSAKIDSMIANGGTNQTVGLAHGMQIQTQGDPYNAPALPANTTRYIILLSDGLNTLDRWYGDGSNQSASVDARMALACTNAKSQGFIIYALFVDIAGAQGNSSVLQSCASDTSKYYDLTTSAAIVTAFNDIAQKITNLRVSR